MRDEPALFNIAVRDLSRLGPKFEIDTLPKSVNRSVIWESSVIPTIEYESFKNKYKETELALRKWLDYNRWLKGLKTDDCWLDFIPDEHYCGIRLIIYRSA